MININNINKTKEISTAKARKTGGGDSFSSYLQNNLKVSSPQVTAGGAISVADAIFAAQTVDGEEERQIRKKLCKRASGLLEKLEEIRDGLLAGQISKDKLIEISRMVKENRPPAQDPVLQEILDEIELRVEVELAKLTR